MTNLQPRRISRELTAKQRQRLEHQQQQVAAELPDLAARDQMRKEAREETTLSGELRRAVHSSQLSQRTWTRIERHLNKGPNISRRPNGVSSMIDTESFLQKLAKQTEGSPAIVPKVKLWMNQEPRFVDFLGEYEPTILKKFREDSTPEYQLDVAAELEAAYLLMDPRTALAYEPRLEGRRRAPDYRVHSESFGCFFVEVKRIRRTAPEQQMDSILRDIVGCLRAIPSSLGFWLTMSDLDREPAEFAKEVFDSRRQVMESVQKQMRIWECELAPGQKTAWVIPGFNDGLSLDVVNVERKDPGTPSAWFGHTFSPPRSKRSWGQQSEWKRLSDTICEKVGQLAPKATNVLFVKVDSDLHRPADLELAIQEINEMIQLANCGFFRKRDKEVANAHNFVEKSRNLSAIVLRSRRFPSEIVTGGNYVWCNENAHYPLTSELADFFHNLGWIGGLQMKC